MRIYVWSDDNSWPIKNSSTYEIYLDKSIEACIGNCSPPPPKPKHTESSTSQRWVPHLPPKIQSVCVTKLRLCKSRFSGTLFLLPISICVYTCVSVWWYDNQTRPCLVRLFWWPPCWEVGDCSPPYPLAHCDWGVDIRLKVNFWWKWRKIITIHA